MADVRLLRTSDLDGTVRLSASAGWNQTEDDWRMLLELVPNGCFGIDADGKLVATTTLVSYGQRLGWIGMVLTQPEYRGRGFARALVTHAIELADLSGIRTVKLDATDQGQHLYESLGFEAEEFIERWSRPGTSNLRLAAGDFCSDQFIELDLTSFGVKRSEMLYQLAKHSRVYSEKNSFLFARTGRNTAYLGPCVADSSASARALIGRAVREDSSVAWSWDLFPQNATAVSIALELGFTRQRVLTRMRRGEPLGGRNETILAIAGFELG